MKVKLIVEIDYEPNGTPFEQIKGILISTMEWCYDEGQLTCEAKAEVKKWSAKVEQVKT